MEEPLPKSARLSTHLTSAEVARETADEEKYPNFMTFLKSVQLLNGMSLADPRNGKYIKTTHVYMPRTNDWKGFWMAAAADHITCLRAFGLLAREIKKNGVVIFGPGGTFEQSVTENHVDLGLALPAYNVGTAIWSPDPANTDPEFQLHLKVFYKEPYVHHFPDEILPANLKIGFGEEDTYWMDGAKFSQRTIDADIYYGPNKGVGFRNVKGIGGQKRGVLGFFQKILFFLPDAVALWCTNRLVREGRNVRISTQQLTRA